MIRDIPVLMEFEKKLKRSGGKPDFFANLRLVEALYHEARDLGVIPLRNPLDGVDIDIRIARIINGVQEPA